jgi:hypothetical protein
MNKLTQKEGSLLSSPEVVEEEATVRTPSPTKSQQASPVQAKTPKEITSPKIVRKSPRKAKTEGQKWLAREKEIHGDVIHQKRMAAERLKENKHK